MDKFILFIEMVKKM